MTTELPTKFNQRLDFYGQSLAAYIVVLVIFLVFYGTLNDGQFTVKLFSPIVILMLAIILITTIMLIVATIKRKQIIFNENTIIFRNRFFSKAFDISEIQQIKISRSPSKVVNDDARFVRIKIVNKKKFILIRTASFDEDAELLEQFHILKNKLA